jgi:hypothetical protein
MSASDVFFFNRENTAFRFGTNNTERMRIDSSGNLLVGKTSTSSNVAGHRLNPRGDIESTRSGGLVAYLNRQSSDGDIAVFAKDGTTVGSIGSSSIGGLEITGNNSSRSLLLTTNFFPANGSGAKNDGAIDLGISDARWKDLHLSGTANDGDGDLRAIPKSGSDKTSAYTLTTGDVGNFIGIGSGGSITVPNNTFSTGDAVSIFNNTSGDRTITLTSISTAYIAGEDSDKSSVTLATRGVCTILFISSTVCVISGTVS